MTRHRRTTIRVVGSALLAALIAGCAAAPLPPARDLTASDTKRLAGSWEWTERFVSPARLGSGPIKVRIADGQMLFETAATTGALTLYEGADRRVLKGEARDKMSGRSFPVSLSQRVRGSSLLTASGPMVSLLVVP
jgi:hypothetical protein